MEESAVQSLDQFVETVKNFLEVRKWTAVRLSKTIGYSAAVVSQFLSKNYPGDVDTIREKITNVMLRESEKDSVNKSSTAFINTSISQKYFDVARACHRHSEIGVIYSSAGLGKTISGREYAAKYSDTIFIEVDPGYTTLYFLEKLHAKVGLSNPRLSIPHLQDEIMEKLSGSGRFLIIDEAEQLPYKTLESIRRINDKAQVGVLLTGMHKLLNNLKGLKNQYAQLFSRVGMSVRLDPLTEKDTRLIVYSCLGCDDDTLIKTFYTESSGITRRLYKIMSRCQLVSETNNNCPIDVDVIKMAGKMVKIEAMS